MHGAGLAPRQPGRSLPERRAQFAETSWLLNREWAARRSGEMRHNAFRAAAGRPAWHPAYGGPHRLVGGPAGFHGGFRGSPGFHAATIGRGSPRGRR